MAYKWNPFTGNLDFYTSDALSAQVLVLKRLANETISAMKVVYLDTPDTCKEAGYETEDQSTAIGIAMNAGQAGDEIKILSFGIVEDPFFQFDLNIPLFLGSDGYIISGEELEEQRLLGNAEWGTYLGYGLGTNRIYVKIERSIKL